MIGLSLAPIKSGINRFGYMLEHLENLELVKVLTSGNIRVILELVYALTNNVSSADNQQATPANLQGESSETICRTFGTHSYQLPASN